MAFIDGSKYGVMGSGSVARGRCGDAWIYEFGDTFG
jgi:hypothetical protein